MTSYERQSLEILRSINNKLDVFLRVLSPEDANGLGEAAGKAAGSGETTGKVRYWSPEAKAMAAKKRAEKKTMKALPAEENHCDFKPFTFDGRDYFKNCRGDVLTEDMTWVGKYNFETNKINTSAKKPMNLNLGGGGHKRKTRKSNK